MSKKEDAAIEAILKYFVHQNRPYSATDVFMNLHKEHGKPLIQRVLDQLVAESKLKEKINGKQKAYFANQDDMPSHNDEQLAQLNADSTKLAETLSKAQEQLKALESQVRKLNSSLTSQKAVARLTELEAQNTEMEERLQKLENEQELVDPVEKAQRKKRREVALTHWKKRKRMCTDALDSVLESWPKKKKDLFDQVGIETDQDVGVTMPPSYPK